jgi:hypothetical protein
MAHICFLTSTPRAYVLLRCPPSYTDSVGHGMHYSRPGQLPSAWTFVALSGASIRASIWPVPAGQSQEQHLDRQTLAACPVPTVTINWLRQAEQPTRAALTRRASV